MQNNKINNILIGTDPEIFLVGEYDNKIVPSYKFIKGDKYNPESITDQGHSIQSDNVMVEYTIPPSSNSDDFIKHNNFMLGYIRDTIASPNYCKLLISAYKEIDPEINEEEAANHFGCEPDYDAYTCNQNHVERLYPLGRSCGAHIHIGYDNPNMETSLDIIKAMDLFISIPLIILEPESLRKTLYGKAGAFRFKPKYGVEYRSPSNWWLTNDDSMKWVFESTLKACNFINEGSIITNEEDIIKAINTNDKILAKDILDDYNIELPSDLLLDSHFAYLNNNLDQGYEVS